MFIVLAFFIFRNDPVLASLQLCLKTNLQAFKLSDMITKHICVVDNAGSCSIKRNH